MSYLTIKEGATLEIKCGACRMSIQRKSHEVNKNLTDYDVDVYSCGLEMDPGSLHQMDLRDEQTRKCIVDKLESASNRHMSGYEKQLALEAITRYAGMEHQLKI